MNTIGHMNTQTRQLPAGIDDGFLTVEQLREVLPLNKFTIYHLIKSDPSRLPVVTRLWGKILFKRSDVNKFMEQAGQAGGQAQETPRRGRGRPRKSEFRGEKA